MNCTLHFLCILAVTNYRYLYLHLLTHAPFLPSPVVIFCYFWEKKKWVLSHFGLALFYFIIFNENCYFHCCNYWVFSSLRKYSYIIFSNYYDDDHHLFGFLSSFHLLHPFSLLLFTFLTPEFSAHCLRISFDKFPQWRHHHCSQIVSHSSTTQYHFHGHCRCHHHHCFLLFFSLSQYNSVTDDHRWRSSDKNSLQPSSVWPPSIVPNSSLYHLWKHLQSFTISIAFRQEIILSFFSFHFHSVSPCDSFEYPHSLFDIFFFLCLQNLSLVSCVWLHDLDQVQTPKMSGLLSYNLFLALIPCHLHSSQWMAEFNLAYFFFSLFCY